MSISQMDIKKMEFKSSLMGYNKVDVQGFLEMVAEEFSKIKIENEKLSFEINKLNEKIQEQERIKTSLENTAEIINSAIGEVKNKAEQEAELIVNSAKLKAEQIISQAHDSNIGLINQIEELKKQKIVMAKRIKNFIDIQSEILKTFENDN